MNTVPGRAAAGKSPAGAPVAAHVVRSPDGRVELAFGLAGPRSEDGAARGSPFWQVSWDGRPMLLPSPVGIELSGAHGTGGVFELTGFTRLRAGRTPPGAPGEPPAEMPACRAAIARLRSVSGPPLRWELHLLCGNKGAAIRCRLPRQRLPAACCLREERMEFLFPRDTDGYAAGAGDVASSRRPLGSFPDRCAFPVTLVYPHGKLARLLEGRGQGWPHSPLRPVRGGLAVSGGSDALLRLPAWSPWRGLRFADRPADLPLPSAFERNLEAAGGAAITLAPDSRSHCTTPFLQGTEGVCALLAAAPGADTARAHRMALRLIFPDLVDDGDAGEGGGDAVRTGDGTERAFRESLPPAWDETRFLRGEIGEFLVVARRRGEQWFVAGITGPDSRVLTVRFADILPFDAPGRAYRLHLFRDALPDENDGCQDIVSEKFDGLSVDDKVMLELASHGGFALRLEPE